MTIEAMKLALEALEAHADLGIKSDKAITALRTAIAEADKQEPVAHLWECLGRWSAYLANNGKQADCAPPSWLVEAVRDATTPPAQRTWVGLTDEEKQKFLGGDAYGPTLHDINAIEAKLKEKNHG
jgi:hypothetical protein